MTSADIEHEIKNWVSWCWSGPWPHPLPPDHAASIEGQYLTEGVWESADVPPPPINAERAQVIQRLYDRASHIERKVLQAEYLSPWQYKRYSAGISYAAQLLKISTAGYDTVLRVMRGRIEKAFR